MFIAVVIMITKNWKQGPSLVVQWLAICLAIQGTQVQSLVGGWDPIRCRTIKPAHHSLLSLCALEPKHHKERSHVTQLRLDAAK